MKVRLFIDEETFYKEVEVPSVQDKIPRGEQSVHDYSKIPYYDLIIYDGKYFQRPESSDFSVDEYPQIRPEDIFEVK